MLILLLIPSVVNQQPQKCNEDISNAFNMMSGVTFGVESAVYAVFLL